MSGLIKIEDYEVTVSENKLSDIALSSFGGYFSSFPSSSLGMHIKTK